ncbi:MarR family winged helix-turn-helix transcriptional regulator [Pseudonocardia kujensis]|uniref:MarR family winged helix-turn-helix transcriptional regulator n=1 Tax=Pseudonocardia kujensis TaxID=1128675 RepID=UPI0027E20953|nr:MarR family transcriptional regulator [Pseudonocardia kujensis]
MTPTASVSPVLADAQVAELARVLERTASWLRRTLRAEEWNAVALAVLDELDRNGPRRVTELAAQERASQPGMTGIVSRLEAAGLVERAPDPSDGRASLVSATRAGHAYIAGRHARRTEFLAERITTLSAHDRRTLLAAAPALAALVDTPSPQAPPAPTPPTPTTPAGPTGPDDEAAGTPTTRETRTEGEPS